eukprot:TRINITY_DN32634_c0_g1_i1.p1 TRINITY_DN32634_c0_g1~~TRINITY_DN32634_c0_g1_i1.p1  ORF type:complete len:337 (-),score=56.04 TRINITY_DN32634_c0_g1_i1:43-1053(-)
MPLRLSLPLLVLAKCATRTTAADADQTYLDQDADYMDDSQACKRWYPNPVATYCPDNFPAKTPQKLQVLLLTSHACGACHVVQPGFIALAKNYAQDPSVDFGVVNCYWAKNYDKICHSYRVDALPTLRIIHDGEWDRTKYKRHDKQEVDAMIRDSMTWWSKRCPLAGFEIGGIVQSLCSKRFMDKSEKHKWLVIFYSKQGSSSSTELLVKIVKQVAADLGNSKDSGSKAKKQEILMALRQSKWYAKFKFGSVQGALKDLLQTTGPLVKVAGVCCDCSTEDKNFCKQKLGSDSLEYLPFSTWFDGELREVTKMEVNRAELMEYVLSNLGVLKEQEEL